VIWHDGQGACLFTNTSHTEVAALRRKPEAEIETVPSEPPSRLVAAPPEKPQIAEAMPAEWRVARVHLLLAGVGGARPAAGLAAGPATARALRVVVLAVASVYRLTWRLPLAGLVTGNVAW
jgi:hypothetical protein